MMRKLTRFSCLGNREQSQISRRSSYLSKWTILFMLAAVLFTPFIPCSPAAAAEDFDTLYDKASLDYRQGKYEEALTYFKKANSLKENANLECLLGLAQTYGKLGAVKNVQKICDQLIQISGDNIGYKSKAWRLRGDALYSAALLNSKPDGIKLQESEAAYREALKINPRQNQAHYELAVALIRLNRIEEALRELRVYIKNADDESGEKARKIIKDPRRALANFAPDFSIVTSDGEYIASDELRGKVVLMDFWGTWCKPCLAEIPFLSELVKKYSKEKFALISVDVRDEEAQWRNFIENNDMKWTHAQDKNSQIQRTFQINVFPSYILIDHEGIIRYQGKGSGTVTETDVIAAIKKALKAAAQPKPETMELSAANSPQPDPKLLEEPASDIPPADGGSGLPDAKLYAVRIPKPVLNSKKMKAVPTPAGTRMQAYTLQVKNWASFPDELFESSKEFPPCNTNVVYQGKAVSARLEVKVLNEEAQVLLTTCSVTKPELLQEVFFTMPDRSKIERVRIQLKDRLTGNSVQSDPLVLW
jgi:thiol-disulfide isomerase/thioredoxin